MRYESKQDLLARMDAEHAAFVELVESVPRGLWTRRGVWGDDWTLKDLLAHLTEWEQMLLGWDREARRGGAPELPAPGFKWSQTPELNRAIWRMHRRRSVAAVRTGFDRSFRQVRRWAEALTEEEIFEKGRFAWTGRNALVSYLGANTVSHYRTGSKIVKRWLRSRAAGPAK